MARVVPCITSASGSICLAICEETYLRSWSCNSPEWRFLGFVDDDEAAWFVGFLKLMVWTFGFSSTLVDMMGYALQLQ